MYPEEFGTLIGRSYSPSRFTLRRFLHKVRKLKKSEALVDEFAYEYLKSGAARWGVLYIDGHFLPYYGMYPITKGWHGLRKIPMKGSYNYPYVQIADTAGCNMRCWFCYSWHFWSHKIAEEQGCKTAFASAERLADEFYCKFESMSNREHMLDTLRQKTFLTAKEMSQSLYHIKKNYPVIRIRISGG